jgi:hypothetical protein
MELERIDARTTVIDAVAQPASADGTQWQTPHGGSSCCSLSDLALTLGPGRSLSVSASAIEIEWPSGARQKLTKVVADKRLAIQEP